MIIVYLILTILVLVGIVALVNLLVRKVGGSPNINADHSCASMIEELCSNNHSKTIGDSINNAEKVAEKHHVKIDYLPYNGEKFTNGF